jgi:hypothetical protein
MLLRSSREDQKESLSVRKILAKIRSHPVKESLFFELK